MELEFKLAWYTTIHFKFIIKNKTVIFFDLKKTKKIYFRRNFKKV